MKLIREELLETKAIITEEKDMYIEGIFMQGEIVNGNKRMYPITVLESAVNKYMPTIEGNRALGELNHPSGPSIDYERAAIKTVSLVREGNNYMGKAKLLSTPLGELCKGLINDGVQLAVSSRGLGSIQKNDEGVDVVQEDFTIAAAADIVSEPSAPDAFVQGVMEGKEWVYGDGGILVEKKVEEIKKTARRSALKVEDVKFKMFNEFINILKTK